MGDITRLVDVLALEPDAARGDWTLLRRDGSGYRLALDSDDDCDVRALDNQLQAAQDALHRRDDATAGQLLHAAITAYTGDLLPDDGPAEWVVAERERLRHAIAAACEDDGFFYVVGHGIAPEKLTDIFRPFVSTKGARGTGLGLAVSRKILREHGGDILVKSKVEEGSIFTMRLPLRSPLGDSQGTQHEMPVFPPPPD